MAENKLSDIKKGDFEDDDILNQEMRFKQKSNTSSEVKAQEKFKFETLGGDASLLNLAS